MRLVHILGVELVEPRTVEGGAEIEIVEPGIAADEADLGEIRPGAAVGAAGHADDDVVVLAAPPSQHVLELRRAASGR